MDVWKTPWLAPLFNSPHRKSILLLKMRLFFCWRFNHRSVTSHSHEHFSVSGIRPLSLSISFLKGIQLAEDQLNVLSRSSRPLVDRACETTTFPAVIPRTKVITIASRSPWGASPWIGFYHWCHAAVCSNASLRASRGWPGVADWQMWRVAVV